MMRASMFMIGAAWLVALANFVALAATPKPRPAHRRYARLAAAPLSALLVCLVSGPALAHHSNYEVDANHNGHVEVYRSGDFQGDFEAYREKANEQLKQRTDEPTIRMVSRKEKAELWVHKSSKQTDCFGRAAYYLGATTDEISLSSECPQGHKMRTLISHEMGHVYGLPSGKVGKAPPKLAHHRCSSYWQKRSVDVGETPRDGRKGCRVLIVGFGPHDLASLAEPG